MLVDQAVWLRRLTRIFRLCCVPWSGRRVSSWSKLLRPVNRRLRVISKTRSQQTKGTRFKVNISLVIYSGMIHESYFWCVTSIILLVSYVDYITGMLHQSYYWYVTSFLNIFLICLCEVTQMPTIIILQQAKFSTLWSLGHGLGSKGFLNVSYLVAFLCLFSSFSRVSISKASSQLLEIWSENGTRPGLRSSIAQWTSSSHEILLLFAFLLSNQKSQLIWFPLSSWWCRYEIQGSHLLMISLSV